MPKVMQLKPAKKRIRFYVKIRTFGNTPVCDMWIMRQVGGDHSEVVHCHRRKDAIEALLKYIDLPVEREDIPQVKLKSEQCRKSSKPTKKKR